MDNNVPVSAVPTSLFNAPHGSWTLVVLPDTQAYAAHFPEIFLRMTQWIAAHRESHDIRFVVHEGDIVDADVHPQWMVAHRALNVLTQANIPMALTLGNHDMEAERGVTYSRSTLLNSYFNACDYRHSKAFGFFEPCRLENSWHEFSTPTGDYLVVALEFGPRAAVIAWANRIVSERPQCRVLVVTHVYLYFDGTRYDWAKYGRKQFSGLNPKAEPYARDGDVSDGEDLWRDFVSLHPQIDFVFSGHTGEKGVAHLASPGSKGGTVHQLLVNYQPRAWGQGGCGFFRLLQFHPDGKTVRNCSYSPWLDRWLDGPDQDFEVSLS
jgi:hypothetical protein